jgi:NADH-quinone oxidoreductase subunit E
MVVEELERQLGIKVGQTTPDGEFTLETANCLGACAIGPVVTADGRYFSKVDTTKVKAILEKVQAGLLEDEESLAAASDG